MRVVSWKHGGAPAGLVVVRGAAGRRVHGGAGVLYTAEHGGALEFLGLGCGGVAGEGAGISGEV